jgi:peptide/nickel transport system substrate-binding protein
MAKRAGLTAISIAAALLLAPALLSGPAAAQSRPNTLAWGFTSDIETMEPYSTAKRTSQLVIRNVLEHLAVRDPKTGEAKPGLATAWKWIDPTTLEFTLRRGVKFHDGQDFDADDVVYTVDYVKKPGGQISFAAADYGFLKSAQKVDQYTVRLILNVPTPSAVDRLSQTLFILPKGAHAKLGKEFGAKPVGTGPYKVTAFEAGRRVEMTRNEGYYAADWGKPRLDKITVITIPDPQTQVAELARGRIDFIWTLQTDQVEQLKRAKDVTVVTGGSVTVRFLSLDAAGRSGANPMQDKNVRMAIAHAINREAIAKVLRGPESQVIDAPCHPKQLGCARDVTKYAYDVAKAKALLKASAHPNGFDLSIAAFTENGPVAEAIIGDLREIGIRAKLDFRETSAWIKDFFGGRMQASVVPWPSNGIYDVSALVPLFFQGDQGDFTRDPEVIAWFKQAGSIIERPERERLYRLGFEKIAREAFVVPLMTDVTNYAYRGTLDFTPPVDGYPLMYMAGWK